MIIWLASYPRSGNTLMRTVIKSSLEIDSYSDEAIRPIVGLSSEQKKSFGHIEYEGSWDEFYYTATNSDRVYLVKTHLPPKDEQPVIYVIRDGRAATESYTAFHKSFQSNTNGSSSLYQLMVGDDYYGDWSYHYQNWASRTNCQFLLLRFEELVDADSRLVNKIAEFIKYSGDIKRFQNPMSDLNQENPQFFRKGEKKWTRPKHWQHFDEALFLFLHQELMLSMNYIHDEELKQAIAMLEPNYFPVLELARRGFEQRNIWLREAEAKELVIKGLISN